MRIIDKNTDYYDYLQNVYRDDSLTFDRTDSFVLTKEGLCDHLFVRKKYGKYIDKSAHDYAFVLLQICNTFWLFLADITATVEYNKRLDKATEYTIELLTSWKNYSKGRAMIKLDVISFGWKIDTMLCEQKNVWQRRYNKEIIRSKTDVLIQAIDTNDYRTESRINRCVVCVSSGEREERRIPLLKACGIANCIDPLDIFLAFEEYFSLEKTSSERTDPIGTTDEDRIEAHGFDTKTSFRGKA